MFFLGANRFCRAEICSHATTITRINYANTSKSETTVKKSLASFAYKVRPVSRYEPSEYIVTSLFSFFLRHRAPFQCRSLSSSSQTFRLPPWPMETDMPHGHLGITMTRGIPIRRSRCVPLLLRSPFEMHCLVA